MSFPEVRSSETAGSSRAFTALLEKVRDPIAGYAESMRTTGQRMATIDDLVWIIRRSLADAWGFDTAEALLRHWNLVSLPPGPLSLVAGRAMDEETDEGQ